MSTYLILSVKSQIKETYGRACVFTNNLRMGVILNFIRVIEMPKYYRLKQIPNLFILLINFVQHHQHVIT